MEQGGWLDIPSVIGWTHGMPDIDGSWLPGWEPCTPMIIATPGTSKGIRPWTKSLVPLTCRIRAWLPYGLLRSCRC
jgi:hypothetical protein